MRTTVSAKQSVCLRLFYTYKLDEDALLTLSMDAQGRVLGVGSQNGCVTLIEPSDSLVELQAQERTVVSAVCYSHTHTHTHTPV